MSEDFAGSEQSLQELLDSMKGMQHREDLLSVLRDRVEYLIQQDFERLVGILYRVDVDEKQLKKTLHEHPEDPGLVIAKMLIERQEQKLQLREKFRQPPPDNPEDAW